MTGDPLLVRRTQARERLGVSDQEFSKLVDSGVITPVYLRRDEDGQPLGRAHYVTRELSELEEKLAQGISP